MRISRRAFLKNFGTAVAATAFPMSNVVAGLPDLLNEKSKDISVPEFVRGFHSWYCKTFFNFDKHFDSVEKAYVEKCTGLMKTAFHKINSDLYYSLVTYSHRITGSKSNSSRVAYGSIAKPQEIQGQIAEILKKRQIPMNEIKNFGMIAGLGWDFEEDHFKVYSYHPQIQKIKDTELRSLLSTVEPTSIQPVGLASITFKNRKAVEKKVYVSLKEKQPSLIVEYPFKAMVAHTNYMITSSRGKVAQVDIAETASMNDYLTDAWKPFQTAYEKQFAKDIPLKNPSGFIDTLTYVNSDNYTVYVL